VRAGTGGGCVALRVSRADFQMLRQFVDVRSRVLAVEGALGALEPEPEPEPESESEPEPEPEPEPESVGRVEVDGRAVHEWAHARFGAARTESAGVVGAAVAAVPATAEGPLQNASALQGSVAVVLDGGRAVIVPHHILVYMANPYSYTF
jgi:hypothetical protein